MNKWFSIILFILSSSLFGSEIKSFISPYNWNNKDRLTYVLNYFETKLYPKLFQTEGKLSLPKLQTVITDSDISNNPLFRVKVESSNDYQILENRIIFDLESFENVLIIISNRNNDIQINENIIYFRTESSNKNIHSPIAGKWGITGHNNKTAFGYVYSPPFNISMSSFKHETVINSKYVEQGDLLGDNYGKRINYQIFDLKTSSLIRDTLFLIINSDLIDSP